MEENTQLIREAEFKTTGANVHAINSATHNYWICVQVANGTAWWVKKYTDELKLKYEIKAKLWEDYLKKFVSTGILDNSLKPNADI